MASKRQPTGLTFEIRTVADFLNVPHTRRAACLREFATFLKLASATQRFLEAVTDQVTGQPGAVQYKTEAFRWCDDGETHVTVEVLPPEGESFSGESAGGQKP